MSGYANSPFLSPNDLMTARYGNQRNQDLHQNELLGQQEGQQRIEQGQQTIGNNEAQAVSRAAGALYSMPEDQAAAAYPGMIADLRSQGHKLANAPSSYPGHAAIGALLQRGMTPTEQINSGMLPLPGMNLPPLPGSPGYGAAPGPGASAVPAGGGDSGGPFAANNPLNIRYVGQEGATNTKGFASWPTPEAGQAATDQQLASYADKGINTLSGLISRWAPPSENNTAGYIATVAKATGLDPNAPLDLRNPAVRATVQKAMAVVEGNKNSPGVQANAAAPQAPAGGGGPQAPYQVASTGPVAPPTQPGAAAPAAAPDLVGPRPLPPTGPGSPVVTPQSIANTPVNALAPPAPAAPPPQQQAQAAPPMPPPPQGQPAPPPQTGTNSPQFQHAQQLLDQAAQYERGASLPGPRGAAYKAEADRLKAQAALYMQADSVVQLPDGTQLHSLTGKTDPSALPARAYGHEENGFWVMRDPQGREVSRTAVGGYEVAKNAYTRDSKEIAGIADAGRAAQSDNIRIQQMRDILQTATTGPGTNTKAELTAWVQRWAPQALTDWTRESANLTGPAAIEMLNKLGLTGAGTQERGVMGSRGGYQAIKMFQQINPGAQLLNATNSGLLAKQLISNQADTDYSQGAQGHFATQENRFGSEAKYQSLAQFDQQWTAQRNPQVYAAAIGAVGGQTADQWAKGLSDTEYKRALDIVSRADPTAVVNGKTGRLSMQPNNGASAQPAATAPAPGAAAPANHPPLPPGFKVVQ